MDIFSHPPSTIEPRRAQVGRHIPFRRLSAKKTAKHPVPSTSPLTHTIFSLCNAHVRLDLMAILLLPVYPGGLLWGKQGGQSARSSIGSTSSNWQPPARGACAARNRSFSRKSFAAVGECLGLAACATHKPRHSCRHAHAMSAQRADAKFPFPPPPVDVGLCLGFILRLEACIQQRRATTQWSPCWWPFGADKCDPAHLGCSFTAAISPALRFGSAVQRRLAGSEYPLCCRHFLCAEWPRPALLACFSNTSARVHLRGSATSAHTMEAFKNRERETVDGNPDSG